MLGSLVLSRVAIHMTQIPRRPRHDRLAAASAHSEASVHLPPHTLPNLLMPPPILLIRHYYSPLPDDHRHSPAPAEQIAHKPYIGEGFS